MTDNYQLIPFPVPEYLAQFLAHKLNTKVRNSKGYPCITVSRTSVYGKKFLQSLEIDQRFSVRKPEGYFFIKVSKLAGDHYSETPNGKRFFLKLKPAFEKQMIHLLKEEFEESLLMFVKGAEFAHKKNGWNPNQKRKGIRKEAILIFCKENAVSLEKRTFDSLFKMIQRHINLSKPFKTKRSQEFAVNMSD